jgi:hypothetical protein
MFGFLFSLFTLFTFDNLVYVVIAFTCGIATTKINLSKHTLNLFGNTCYKTYSNWKYGISYLFNQGKKTLIPTHLQELVNNSKFLPLNTFMMYVNVPQPFWVCLQITHFLWKYFMNFNWIMISALILLYTCDKNNTNCGTTYVRSSNKFKHVRLIYLLILISGFILFSTGFAKTLLTTPMLVLYHNDIGTCDYYLHGVMVKIAVFLPLPDISIYTCETYSINKTSTSPPIVLSIGDFVMFCYSLVLLTTMVANTSEILTIFGRVFENIKHMMLNSSVSNDRKLGDVEHRRQNPFNINGHGNAVPRSNLENRNT